MRPTADSPNLDLLRSLAVIYVVAFHLWMSFNTTNLLVLHTLGMWGVLLFFVHTSLVLMYSLERQETRSPGTNIFAPFYVRRCFRILPLSMLVVTALAVFGWPAIWERARFCTVHLSALGFISNLFLVQNLTGAPSITLPLWSLPYEMQMYLIFPILYLLVRAVRNVRPIAGLWFATAVAAYIARYMLHGPYPSFLTLAPCFMAGIVTYKVCQMKTRRSAFIGWPLVILIAAYLYWRQPAPQQQGWLWYLLAGLPLLPLLMARLAPSMSGKLSEKKLPFIGWPAMILLTTYLYLRVPSLQRGWIWCLIVGTSLPCFSEMGQNWLRKVCHVVARYSYGIYLVHFICNWLAFQQLRELPAAVRWLVFLVTVAGIPVILYHFLEAPMISLGRRITDRMASRAEKPPQLVPAASLNSGDGELPITCDVVYPVHGIPPVEVP
jgi:peptidoglycan/LPS O-acetylase OafA/YrhL